VGGGVVAEAGVQAHHLSLARGRGGPGHGGLGQAGGGRGLVRGGGGEVAGGAAGGGHRGPGRGGAGGGGRGAVGGGELGRVPGLLGGDGLGRGALPLQLVLGGLLLSGRSFGLLGGGVQILAVVVTEWLRLGSLGRVPRLTTGHFAYFTFGRKIVLAFRAVRRVSNHFGIGNVSFWQRTKIQYGDQYYAVYVLCLVLRELSWKF
jgi:hypothetical protein